MILDRFGISPSLMEGHHGIFEVVVKGNFIYTNAGQCGILPTDEAILWEVRKIADPLPGKERGVGPPIPMFRPK